MSRRTRRHTPNVDEFARWRPRRLLAWEELADGRVAVLRPKFGPSRFGRWLSSRLARPDLRVKLDALGSAVWRQCDGERTVAEIANALERDGTERLEDLPERLPRFLYALERGGLIGWGTSD